MGDNHNSRPERMIDASHGVVDAGLISRLLKWTLLNFILNTVHKFTFQYTDNELGWTPRTQSYSFNCSFRNGKGNGDPE